MFGSCPLTDEFIESYYVGCYYAISAEAEIGIYMRDKLNMSYTDEFLAHMEEMGYNED